MAQGSGFTSRGPLSIPLTPVPSAPTIRSGASGRRRAAQTLDEIGGQITNIGEDLVEADRERIAEEEAAAGEAAGQAAALKGEALAPRDSGFWDTVLGADDQAFNDAATVGYGLGLQVEIEDTRQRMEIEHEDDPDAGVKAWGEYSADVLKRTPEGFRTAATLLLEQQGNKAEYKWAGQKAARAQEEAAFNARTRLDQLATKYENEAFAAGDPVAATDSLGELKADIGAMVATGQISGAFGASVLSSAVDRTFVASYRGAWQRNPTPEALEFFLANPPVELDQQSYQALAGEFAQDLRDQESDRKAAERQFAEDAALEDTATRYNEGRGANSRKEADQLWTRYVGPQLGQEASGAPEGEQGAIVRNGKIDFARRTGYANPDTVTLVKRAEGVDDPLQLARAAQEVADLRDNARGAHARLDVGPRVEATNAYAEAFGLPLDQAAQMVIDQSREAPEIIERRQVAFDDLDPITGRDLLLGTVSGSGGGWFDTDAIIPEDVAIDAEKAYEAAYLRTGNVDAARELAKNTMRARYGTSYVGGGQQKGDARAVPGDPVVAERPPEPHVPGVNLFGVETAATIIDEEIYERLAAEGVVIPELPAWAEGPDYKLVPKGHTAAGKERWEIWLRDEFANYAPSGLLYTVPDAERQKGISAAVQARGEAEVARLNVAIAEEAARLAETRTAELSGQTVQDPGDPARLQRLIDKRDQLEDGLPYLPKTVPEIIEQSLPSGVTAYRDRIIEQEKKAQERARKLSDENPITVISPAGAATLTPEPAPVPTEREPAGAVVARVPIEGDALSPAQGGATIEPERVTVVSAPEPALSGERAERQGLPSNQAVRVKLSNGLTAEVKPNSPILRPEAAGAELLYRQETGEVILPDETAVAVLEGVVSEEIARRVEPAAPLRPQAGEPVARQRPTGAAQQPVEQRDEGKGPGVRPAPDLSVKEIMAMSLPELLALDMTALSDEQLSAVAERGLELQAAGG